MIAVGNRSLIPRDRIDMQINTREKFRKFKNVSGVMRGEERRGEERRGEERRGEERRGEERRDANPIDESSCLIIPLPFHIPLPLSLPSSHY